MGQKAGGGPVIRGFRVRPADTRDAFDFYVDENGEVLDNIDLAALRVSPKDWSVPLVERGATTAGGKKAAVKSIVPLTPERGVSVKRVDLSPLDMAQSFTAARRMNL